MISLKEPSSSTNSESKKTEGLLVRLCCTQEWRETESGPATPSCSARSASQHINHRGGVFPQRKRVLSSKLKQLLQTQDKLTPPAGISAARDIPKLGPVLRVAPASMLPVTSSRFKRREPALPQLSPAQPCPARLWKTRRWESRVD